MIGLVALLLSLVFPITLFGTIIFDSCRKKSRYFLPRIERLARLSYISEYKAVGSVLGSYCPDLKVPFRCCDKSVPRIHAILRLLL